MIKGYQSLLMLTSNVKFLSMIDEPTQNQENTTSAKFKCPKCGKIERDDVVFLCNTCEQKEMIHKDGIYMCPSCLKPGKNFECMLCDSKEVEMKF